MSGFAGHWFVVKPPAVCQRRHHHEGGVHEQARCRNGWTNPRVLDVCIQYGWCWCLHGRWWQSVDLQWPAGGNRLVGSAVR